MQRFEKFDWTENFETVVAGLLTRDVSFASAWLAQTESALFPDPLNRALVRFARWHWLKHRSLPDLILIEHHLRRMGDAGVPILERARQLAALDLSGRVGPAGEELGEFLRERAFARAIEDGYRLLERGDKQFAEKMSRAFREADRVGASSLATSSMDFLSGKAMVERAKRRVLDERLRAPTGFEGLDTLLGGGLAAGEMAVFMGGTGAGKSHAGVYVGAATILRGGKALHVTLEMDRYAIAARYDRRLGQSSERQIYLKPHKWIRAIAAHYSNLRVAGGALLIEDFNAFDAAGQMTTRLHRETRVSDISRLLYRLQDERDFRPDILIVDMADHLGPERRRDARREEVTEVYRDLRHLAREHGTRVFTMSHVTRASQTKRLIGVADIAEDINKARIADLIVASCQTETEKTRHEIRFHIAKSRASIDGIVLRYQYDFGMSQFYPLQSGEDLRRALLRRGGAGPAEAAGNARKPFDGRFG